MSKFCITCFADGSRLLQPGLLALSGAAGSAAEEARRYAGRPGRGTGAAAAGA